jgi:hypothetical protein
VADGHGKSPSRTLLIRSRSSSTVAMTSVAIVTSELWAVFVEMLGERVLFVQRFLAERTGRCDDRVASFLDSHLRPLLDLRLCCQLAGRWCLVSWRPSLACGTAVTMGCRGDGPGSPILVVDCSSMSRAYSETCHQNHLAVYVTQCKYAYIV